MDLELPIPDEFKAFPYQRPYGIQQDLMRHLWSAIENRKVTIVESPTGTGKTLSLLCSALTWLLDDKARARKGQLAISSSEGNEPDWVVAQTIERRRRALEEADEQYDERLRKARAREEALKRMFTARTRKKLKPTGTAELEVAADDDHFLPEDEDEETTSGDDNFSPAVRSLMAKFLKSSSVNETEDEPTCTKIYYASRTHSQLTQTLPEMRRLKLGTVHSATNEVQSTQAGLKRPLEESDADNSENVVIRSVSLGSRKQLCIHDDLRRQHGDLDEACRQLLNEKEEKRCPYLPPAGEDEKIYELRDQILASPKDIEELAEVGRMSGTCPYFGSRAAISQAQLVTLPYNLLLQPIAREALGIDLKDQVIVIDEAHNLIPTLLSLASVHLPYLTLSTSLQQLATYYTRFRTRLSAKHGLHIKRLVLLLKELQAYAGTWQTTATVARKPVGYAEVITPGELLQRLGQKVEGINVLDISKYLRASKLARKINGYAETIASKAEAGKTGKFRTGANPPLHTVEEFIIALASPNDDGRVAITLAGAADQERVEFKYQLLNPATNFRQVVEDARAIILAGGTMSPMSDYVEQLFSHIPPERFSTFSCGHIIPPENLQAVILGKGPTGKELELKFANRDDPALIAEIGQIILNFAGLIPAGMIVFLPSYAFLNAIVAVWTKSGFIQKLSAKKKIFMEPQGSDVESVLRDYAAEIRKLPPAPGVRSPGALLLAVVGAKLSEGLNFADELARGVLIVGLPFPNARSPELAERMKYVQRTARRTPGGRDPATELYENMAMNAVNQSIGRAIRHARDWAGLILIDTRYAAPRIRGKLPKWIGESVCAPETFGGAMKALGAFYRNQRQAQA